MNDIFHTLAEEAKFTHEMLASGVTQIRKANYARKGLYFQSFTSLSTGLERIGKLCLLLDHYIKSGGEFPDINVLKFEIGHKLDILYDLSKGMIKDHQLALHFRKDLDDPILQEIIRILSDFAKGERYSNLHFLQKKKKTSDPITRWTTGVDEVLYTLKVSPKRKAKIESGAMLANLLLANSVQVLYVGESRKEITTIQEASRKTGIADSIGGHRQMYLLQIIRYWVELLSALQHRAGSLRKQEFSAFSEIFAIFFNYDDYFKTRKSFERLR